MDLAGRFNKSNGYISILAIMDCFTSYIHLIPLNDPATSEKIFKKRTSTIFDVYCLSVSIGLDQDSRLTCKFWSQMTNSLGNKVWIATQYH